MAVNSGMEDLSSGNQQDGVEFMTFLMDILPVEFTFHSRLEKVSFKYTESGTCPICGNFPNDRIETGNILHLSIANSGSNTIANLLVNYFSSQSLEGGKRCLYCCTHETCCPRTGKCVSRPVTTERKIVDFPNVLFIQVKRFETNFRTGYSSKILTDVKVEESVTMDGVTYNIKGILNHIGTFENGHYTAIIKNKGLWYLCDDSNFPKVIAPKEVFNNCNYLFVYEKSNEVSEAIPTRIDKVNVESEAIPTIDKVNVPEAVEELETEVYEALEESDDVNVCMNCDQRCRNILK